MKTKKETTNKKKEKKPCMHEDGLSGDTCDRCGFFQGSCDKCGEYIAGDDKEGYDVC